jgi:hypothetical protein
MAKTKIEFKFVRPTGFSITGKGNFWPKIIPKTLFKYRADHPELPIPPLADKIGITWVFDYDFDEILSIELPSEEVAPLPPHIDRHQDETIRTAHKMKQAEIAAAQFAENNEARGELRKLEESGFIKIISDTFFDASPGQSAKTPQVEAPVQEKKKPGRPRKPKVVV